VGYHLHPGDIPFHPVGLELIFLPIGQEVVDRVLQSTLVAMDPRCDGLLGSISNSIAVRSPESWSLVSAEDSGSEENLCEGLSTRPERRTSLIPYRGAVVMPRCSSRARSLPARTRASTPKDSTSYASRYFLSFSASLRGVYSSLALSSMSWSFGCFYSSAGET
jgi:hypothetical protein